MQLGAATNEIALVIYLMVLIAIAPKVGRIGEIIGGLFERGGAATGAGGGDRESGRDPGE